MKTKNWWLFRGTRKPRDVTFPEPPPWRNFQGEVIDERPLPEDPDYRRRFGELERGTCFEVGEKELDLVNTALLLRRPLLVTGRPGTGKSSLAYAVAHGLKLGPVLRWPITSRTTVQEALYRYDAVGRLQETELHRSKDEPAPDIGRFIRLGPLGTALLPAHRPRVLLIDEIDKSDIDLPNDLLTLFEDGQFEIPELVRLADDGKDVQVRPDDGDDRVTIREGRVMCRTFPFVVITSNGERELPAAFKRRCLRLDISPPDAEKLARIVEAHFGKDPKGRAKRRRLMELFLERRDQGGKQLATDQLLNAIYLTTRQVDLLTGEGDKDALIDAVLRSLGADD